MVLPQVPEAGETRRQAADIGERSQGRSVGPVLHRRADDGCSARTLLSGRFRRWYGHRGPQPGRPIRTNQISCNNSTCVEQWASGPLKVGQPEEGPLHPTGPIGSSSGVGLEPNPARIDEHTAQLARVALDFAPNLDAAFGTGISKAIAEAPIDLREEIEPVLDEVRPESPQQRHRISSARRAARSDFEVHPRGPRHLPPLTVRATCRGSPPAGRTQAHPCRGKRRRLREPQSEPAGRAKTRRGRCKGRR